MLNEDVESNFNVFFLFIEVYKINTTDLNLSMILSNNLYNVLKENVNDMYVIKFKFSLLSNH